MLDVVSNEFKKTSLVYPGLFDCLGMLNTIKFIQMSNGPWDAVRSPFSARRNESVENRRRLCEAISRIYSNWEALVQIRIQLCLHCHYMEMKESKYGINISFPVSPFPPFSPSGDSSIGSRVSLRGIVCERDCRWGGTCGEYGRLDGYGRTTGIYSHYQTTADWKYTVVNYCKIGKYSVPLVTSSVGLERWSWLWKNETKNVV